MTTAAHTPRAKEVKHKEATAILRADHKHVSDLFEQFENAEGRAKKEKIAHEICNELTVHAQIEEEIFYPAIRDVLDDKELLPEAEVEHGTLKVLIGDIESSGADDELFAARVKVLGEYVKHHVKEEQNEIFPQVRDSNLDMVELGALLTQRKEELKKQLG
ncbi:MAG: hemerythrin domain-containing protein [Pseudomonadota bacterium]